MEGMESWTADPWLFEMESFMKEAKEKLEIRYSCLNLATNLLSVVKSISWKSRIFQHLGSKEAPCQGLQTKGTPMVRSSSPNLEKMHTKQSKINSSHLLSSIALSSENSTGRQSISLLWGKKAEKKK